MLANRSLTLLTLATAAVLMLLPGCLERKETITVKRDGAVLYRINLTGDPGDFAAGDALPEERGGWEIDENIVVKDNGDREQRRQAERSFKARQELPDSFADPDDANYGVAVMFPTTVTVERGSDGTFYHFKRVYQARAQARYDRWRQKLEKAFDDLDEITDAEPDTLTDEQRMRLFEFFRQNEACKQSEYVAAGAAALEDEWPQHFGLLLRDALFEYFNGADIEPLAKLIADPDTPERDAAINEAAERLLAGSREALADKLHELKATREQIDLFFAAHDEELARRAVTEDIDDDTWEVSVRLPGKIVSHNGDEVGPEGVVWKFDGKALHDCDVVLMATSRLGPHDRTEPDDE